MGRKDAARVSIHQYLVILIYHPFSVKRLRLFTSVYWPLDSPRSGVIMRWSQKKIRTYGFEPDVPQAFHQSVRKRGNLWLEGVPVEKREGLVTKLLPFEEKLRRRWKVAPHEDRTLMDSLPSFIQCNIEKLAQTFH